MKIFIKITFFIFFILSFKNSNAQKSYSIWYKYYTTDTSLPVFKGPNVHYQYDSVQVRTIFNDSLIYSYYIYDKKDRLKKKLEFGNKVDYQSIYYNKINDEVYRIERHLLKKKMLLNMYRTPKNWIPLMQKKQILGYDCESVFMLSKKSDSTIIFYTKTLKTSASPFSNYFDVPGVVLQIIDKQKKTMVIADKIDEKEYKIVMPKLEIITESDFNELINTKKQKIKLRN